MIKKELLKNKINFIQKELELLSEYKNYSFEKIVSDYFIHSVIERMLERIINDALSINQHIISEKGKNVPNDYRETFIALGDLKIMPTKFSEEISKSVGLRNILVHKYRELDEKLFFGSMKSCLKDYTKYCDYILKYAKNIN